MGMLKYCDEQIALMDFTVVNCLIYFLVSRWCGFLLPDPAIMQGTDIIIQKPHPLHAYAYVQWRVAHTSCPT